MKLRATVLPRVTQGPGPLSTSGRRGGPLIVQRKLGTHIGSTRRQWPPSHGLARARGQLCDYPEAEVGNQAIPFLE